MQQFNIKGILMCPSLTPPRTFVLQGFPHYRGLREAEFCELNNTTQFARVHTCKHVFTIGKDKYNNYIQTCDN